MVRDGPRKRYSWIFLRSALGMSLKVLLVSLCAVSDNGGLPYMVASSCRTSGNRFLPRNDVVDRAARMVRAMIEVVCVPKKCLAYFGTSVVPFIL